MASTRDNTDFLYNTPDIVNPVYESSRHTHNIVHVAEIAGLGVGYLTNAALFVKGASLGLPHTKTFDSIWGARSEMWSHGTEYLEHLNLLPAALSSLTAATIALAYGKNWEEKLQGASLGAAEFTSERIAQHLGEKLIENHFKDFEGKGVINKNSIKWLAREVGGTALGLALIPVFNYTFKAIGREIDKVATKNKEGDENSGDNVSAHHPHVRHRKRIVDGGPSTRGHIRTRTTIDDENTSRRDVEESISRRIVHGHAF